MLKAEIQKIKALQVRIQQAEKFQSGYAGLFDDPT